MPPFPAGLTVATQRQLAEWAISADYHQAAKATFLEAADSELIAHAMANDFVLVTHEQPDASPKRIKIPEAAAPHGVRCMSPFQMLRIERARFVLEEAA